METATLPRCPAGTSSNSSFFCDGYNDAKAGLPASPPSHPETWVFEMEYLAGYRSFSRS
jgi:hypothetical protein